MQGRGGAGFIQINGDYYVIGNILIKVEQIEWGS